VTPRANSAPGETQNVASSAVATPPARPTALAFSLPWHRNLAAQGQAQAQAQPQGQASPGETLAPLGVQEELRKGDLGKGEDRSGGAQGQSSAAQGMPGNPQAAPLLQAPVLGWMTAERLRRKLRLLGLGLCLPGEALPLPTPGERGREEASLAGNPANECPVHAQTRGSTAEPGAEAARGTSPEGKGGGKGETASKEGQQGKAKGGRRSQGLARVHRKMSPAPSALSLWKTRSTGPRLRSNAGTNSILVSRSLGHLPSLALLRHSPLHDSPPHTPHLPPLPWHSCLGVSSHVLVFICAGIHVCWYSCVPAIICTGVPVRCADCIGSAFNAKGMMQCPNCRAVEDGQWLFCAPSGGHMDDLLPEEYRFEDEAEFVLHQEEESGGTGGPFFLDEVVSATSPSAAFFF